MELETRELSVLPKETDNNSIVSEGLSHRSVKSKVSEHSTRKNTQLAPLKKTPSINYHKNPFNVPEDIFAFRDQERKLKQEERQRQKSLKIYEKSYGTNDRLKFREVATLHNDIDDENDEHPPESPYQDQSLVVKEDPDFVIAATKGRHIEKETLSEYISKKREMFLVQYSLGVKREEMRKLEEISAAEEKKLEIAEQYLEEDATIFDEFLKENDKNAVDAMKVAETESKERMQLVTTVKTLTLELMQIKSEISKYEEQLAEYKKYKQFLDHLIPENKERDEALAAKREAKQKAKEQLAIEAAKQKERSEAGSQNTSRKKSLVRRKSSEISPRPSISVESTDITLNDSSDEESEMELYFKDPQELLKIFTELEESNLSLIQTCQETEESLDELKQISDATEKKMREDTDVLNQQIAKLEKLIGEEKEKISDLEFKKNAFKTVQNQDNDAFLARIHEKVAEVYKNTVSNNEAKMSTLDMLVRIEGQLECLFEATDQMPAKSVEVAQRKKDLERREQLREENRRRQEMEKEESRRKALERAKALPKKHNGRRIIGRSMPPQREEKDPAITDMKNKEEEELLYFFT